MRAVDVIAKKRDGCTLSREEIEFFVSGVTRGTLPDYQTSALLMAITLRGMTIEETSWLTESMVNSGARVDLSDIPGVKVGKHSTGGVGDKVSIILGIEEFKAVLRAVGTCIIGQSASLVPADKKLYALRDVTATIGSIPLISASVMSKKLAEGSDVVMLDVKCGDGAFMKQEADARALAASMVAIGTRAGVRTEAFITGMEQPLGRAVGNSLEVIECLETLKGRGPDDLNSVVKRFASRVLVLAGGAQDEQTALCRVETALASGKALETFGRMIERQGGDRAVIDDYALLPSVAQREYYRAPRDGYLTRVKAEAIGLATHLLGAGRSTVGEPIDHAVGVILHAKPGARVERGDPIIEIHHRDGRGVNSALALCGDAIAIGDEAPPHQPAILGEVR
jgi:pyrimidine-nucleoside phosphorylase